MLHAATIKKILAKAGKDTGFDTYFVGEFVEPKEVKIGRAWHKNARAGERSLCLFGQVVSSSARFEGLPAVRVCEISQEEADLMEKLSALEFAAEDRVKAAAEVSANEYADWAANLVGRTFGDGLTVGRSGFFCDESGNLIRRIPSRVMSDSELAAFVADNADFADFDDCE